MKRATSFIADATTKAAVGTFKSCTTDAVQCVKNGWDRTGRGLKAAGKGLTNWMSETGSVLSSAASDTATWLKECSWFGSNKAECDARKVRREAVVKKNEAAELAKYHAKRDAAYESRQQRKDHPSPVV